MTHYAAGYVSKNSLTMEVELKRREISAARRKRQREAAERIRREHAEAFAQPLIDGVTLSAAERKDIRERVLGSGQRSWCVQGMAMP